MVGITFSLVLGIFAWGVYFHEGWCDEFRIAFCMKFTLRRIFEKFEGEWRKRREENRSEVNEEK